MMLMERQKIQAWINRIFFGILLLVSLLNVFYIPHQYTDRFFTAGMVWIGMIVPVFCCLFVFFISRRLRLSGMWLYIVGLVMGYSVYAGITGIFPMQQMTFMGALCLLALMLSNSEDDLKLKVVYFLLSGVAFIESLLGFLQYLGEYIRYSPAFPVTGTFENPAGLIALLILCFPSVLYFICQDSRAWKIGGWTVASLLVVVIGLSGARTGMLALGILCVVCFRERWRQLRMKKWMKITGLLLIPLISVGLYELKKDSANGRILVWCVSGKMFGDAPLLGHGPGAFSARYMDYQGEWLKEHPDSYWGQLADNVKHPFNEFLKIGIEYGLAGLLAIGVFIGGLWRLYRNKKPEERSLFLGLLGLGICALFSYPLNYPAVCVLLFLLLGLIVRRQRGLYLHKWLGISLMGSMAVGILLFTVHWKNAEVQWHRIAHLSLMGKTEEVLSDYARLYPFMRENPLFLYNYGAELHEIGRWNESANLLEECVKGLNDTDVQMLLADNYLHLQDFGRAEQHYWQAARMCPNRFLPLYELVKLYRQTGQEEEVLNLASKIIDKPVKVPSYTIDKIKQEMRRFLSEREKEISMDFYSR